MNGDRIQQPNGKSSLRNGGWTCFRSYTRFDTRHDAIKKICDVRNETEFFDAELRRTPTL